MIGGGRGGSTPHGFSQSASSEREGICPAVRREDVGTEGVASHLAPILARNRPFLLSGCWTQEVLRNNDGAQQWKSFGGIKTVLASNGLDQLRVDVSCTRRGESFRGDKAHREQVRLKLVDMVDIAEAQELGKPHWATSEAVGLDFFLCQCPVVSRSEGNPEVLAAIAGEFRTPSCVPESDLLQINLWLGATETTTNMHYDSNHNLLFVLKGSKRVALLPPSMAADVQAFPVFSESANHSGLHAADTAALVEGPEALRKGSLYADVREGEALFIPEGWWHQVSSSRGTVAVNVWFKGRRPALCEIPSARHMRQYYLRCLIDSLLADRLQEATADGVGGGRGCAATTVADIELTAAATGSSDEVGRPGSDDNDATAATSSPSPLCGPGYTTKQRNAYLRTMGIESMKQELPRIAHESPADWARIVAGLDPLTAFVVTTQWEAAGGAASLPEFYAAIFGTGEESVAGPPAVATGAPTAAATGGSTSGEVVVGSGVVVDSCVAGEGGADGDPSAGGEGGAGGVVSSAGCLQQQQEQQQKQQGYVAGGVTLRPEEYTGVALQERLVRLREAFAKEQCAAVLREATGC